MAITITNTNIDITRHRFIKPFGFKGGASTEKWLAHALLTDSHDNTFEGAGGLAVLWSDKRIFHKHGEVGGSLIMANILEHALVLARDFSFNTPFDLIDHVLEKSYSFGKFITGHNDLRKTFALNSLVSLDNSAWLAYAKEKGAVSFDEMLLEEDKKVLSNKHKTICSVPLISYQITTEQIISLVDKGHFFLKIKIGAAGDRKQMLAKDKQRIKEIHEAIGDKKTAHTDDGKLRYYLDANSRYPDRAALVELLEYADSIGMKEQIAVIEEPLEENHSESLEGLDVLIAADESLHDPEDVITKANLGYGALALKPAGKTLSVTLQMARKAKENGLHCFVADSTCTPASLDWNRNVAARLDPLPGLNMGLIESNGVQNLKEWQSMIDNHPCNGASWLEPKNGMFYLDDDFYKSGGGVFENG